MMPTILVWWWIFLVAALLVTLVDVYLLMRVVNLSRQVYTLSGRSLPAARGIIGNTAAGADLNRLVQLVSSLAKKGDDLGQLTGVLVEQLTPDRRESC
jgi:hypothetical protein